MEEKVTKKIGEMVYAVVGATKEDRDDFCKLSKTSQDLLIAELIDMLAEGQLTLLGYVKR